VGAPTNAMEISREVELAQLSLMVHVVRVLDVIGEMEDLALANHVNVQAAEAFAGIEENDRNTWISRQGKNNFLFKLALYEIVF